MRRTPAITAALTLAVVTGCGGGAGGQGGAELAEQVRQAVSDSYGSIPEIRSMHGRDAPRITVVTDLSDTAENRQAARDLCMIVASVGITVPDFTGVYVTAGEGGPFLAECDAVR